MHRRPFLSLDFPRRLRELGWRVPAFHALFPCGTKSCSEGCSSAKSFGCADFCGESEASLASVESSDGERLGTAVLTPRHRIAAKSEISFSQRTCAAADSVHSPRGAKAFCFVCPGLFFFVLQTSHPKSERAHRRGFLRQTTRGRIPRSARIIQHFFSAPRQRRSRLLARPCCRSVRSGL